MADATAEDHPVGGGALAATAGDVAQPGDHRAHGAVCSGGDPQALPVERPEGQGLGLDQIGHGGAEAPEEVGHGAAGRRVPGDPGHGAGGETSGALRLLVEQGVAQRDRGHVEERCDGGHVGRQEGFVAPPAEGHAGQGPAAHHHGKQDAVPHALVGRVLLRGQPGGLHRTREDRATGAQGLPQVRHGCEVDALAHRCRGPRGVVAVLGDHGAAGHPGHGATVGPDHLDEPLQEPPDHRTGIELRGQLMGQLEGDATLPRSVRGGLAELEAGEVEDGQMGDLIVQLPLVVREGAGAAEQDGEGAERVPAVTQRPVEQQRHGAGSTRSLGRGAVAGRWGLRCQVLDLAGQPGSKRPQRQRVLDAARVRRRPGCGRRHHRDVPGSARVDQAEENLAAERIGRRARHTSTPSSAASRPVNRGDSRVLSARTSAASSQVVGAEPRKRATPWGA